MMQTLASLTSFLIPTRKRAKRAEEEGEEEEEGKSAEAEMKMEEGMVTARGEAASSSSECSHLPLGVLELVVEHLDPEWRGVVRHVSRDWRAAVEQLEAGDGNSKGRGRISSAVVCNSSEALLRWANDQGCPGFLRHRMVAAAGRQGPWPGVAVGA
jgi:hypothetical protein